MSAVLGGSMSASDSLLIHDSDQHGEIDPLIDPPVDAMDRTDSLAFLLKHAIDLISTVLNDTEAQVSAIDSCSCSYLRRLLDQRSIASLCFVKLMLVPMFVNCPTP